MKNEVISERQATILIILFIIGTSFLRGSGGGDAKQDAWIAIIIAILWSIILLLMFSKILSSYPGKDLFDILQIVMGKFIGKTISILMIWFAFHDGSLTLRSLSEFTDILALPDTPVVVPMIFFTILLIWCLKEGIEVLGRWSEFFIWIVILIFFTVSIFSISQMNISKLKPILSSGAAPLLRGAFSSFTYPFGETVIFTMVFSNISKVRNYKKTFMVGLLVGGGLIFLATLRNILVLGSGTLSRLYFPSPTVISLIHLGNLLQRLEMTVAIQFLVCVFVKVSICIFAVCNGISKVFGFNDYKFIATPVALLMFNFSFFVYESTMEMSSWTLNILPYYSFVFEVIIPLVIFIVVEIRSRSSKTTSVIK
ncbi:endospore germination permease [Clostridium sp. CM028]|uniref:GerAB/ArcD/ProY family transporter n=1 Tax=unclassified Clostridium TaxID=2614128 RepID=UPI001C0B9CA7|nr:MULTISPECIES: endospore germination permease [unclassified Clostridium]MBU3091791.1 endospore germination permease [Clostridium sp. CF011]MBW9145423.1 endospore germination permease [Clostridium sp. CM027]MBW9148759.1 endospore germination permease [Clostridium sp. CM028]UVE39403.1 endospore germination permease [Clostridium sp. CM027]WAG68308.1 endospore germination permease [Clostridium sp. CF011]